MQKNMNIYKQIVLAAALSFSALAAQAAVGNPEQNKEYKILKRAQPVEKSKKIEVTEVFAYFCGHCDALDPVLAEWVKKQGDRIIFKRIHGFNPQIEAHQRIYLTLEALGKVEEFHPKVFAAYHVDRNRLLELGQVEKFVAKVGLDKAKFFDMYNSFTVTSKVKSAERAMTDYEIDGFPTLIVDGRFQTSPTMAVTTLGRVGEEKQNRELLPVLDWLVAKAEKDKGIVATKAPAEKVAVVDKVQKEKAPKEKAQKEKAQVK